VQHLFVEYADGFQRYAAFLATDLASSVTFLDIFGRLYASLLVNHNHRPIQTGDATDVQILSNLLPYCHVVTTDKFMKEVVRALKLDERFGSQVFSGTVEDIGLLTRHIEALLAARPAANVPALSMLIVPDAQIKDQMLMFFRALMVGAQRWESRRDQWIELVNVNDGDYPVYQHAQSGLLLPSLSFFFEFDDEIASQGSDSISLAGQLRADVAVVVDSYHDLDDDFVEDVFKAVESGAPLVPEYGWRIIRKP